MYRARFSVLMLIVFLTLMTLTACDPPTKPTTPVTNDVVTSLLRDEHYVSIVPGEFLMGSPDQNSAKRKQMDELASRERPAHQVRLTCAFEIGKYEVTQPAWQAVMAVNPSAFKGTGLPVTNVSWPDVQEFIKRLQRFDGRYRYRLPTEAEWEYVCRAGKANESVTLSPNDRRDLNAEHYAAPLKPVGWFVLNSLNRPHPAGRLEPNAWGLYDLHGNVAEWCLDWYAGYAKEMGENPQGPSNGNARVVRGGDWSAPAALCRCAARSNAISNERSQLLGFRLVRVKREQR